MFSFIKKTSDFSEEVNKFGQAVRELASCGKNCPPVKSAKKEPDNDNPEESTQPSH